jgi:hypothetical protein
VRETRSPGSVRGVLSNGHSYRDSFGNGVPRGSCEVNELISAWLVSDFSLQDSEIFQ